jgi:ribosomal protein L3
MLCCGQTRRRDHRASAGMSPAASASAVLSRQVGSLRGAVLRARVREGISQAGEVGDQPISAGDREHANRHAW